MTKAQITSVLNSTGNAFNQWITLEDDFHYFVLKSDKNNFISASAVQFYFSGTHNYFLTRHLMGRPSLSSLEASVPEGYTKVFHDGNYYLIKIEPGGVVHPTAGIGVFHDLTAYSEISGFYKK